MRWISVLLFVVGCGEVKAKQPDGGAGDGGTEDAAPDGPSIGEASITVKLGGVVTVGRPVVFNEADGTIAGEGMTDGNGVAKATVHVGATVTVAVTANELVTIAGVAPGDDIVLENPKPYDNSDAGTVAFSSLAEANGKSFYRVDLGDDQYVTATAMTSGTRTLDFVRGNIDAGGKIHVVAGVYDATNRLIGYGFQTGVTPNLNGTTAVSFPNWRTDLVDIDVSLSGAPTESTLLRVESANETGGFSFIPSAFAGADQASVAGGQAAVIVPYLGGFGDFIQTSATLTVSNTEKFTWTRRVSRPAGDLVLAAADMPPRIASPTLDTSMATRPAANWTIQNGNAAAGDALVVQLHWRDGGGSGSYSWYAFIPPDATSIQFPVVPSAMTTQAPAQSSIYTIFEVAHHDLSPLEGFTAFHLAPPLDFANLFALPAGFHRWVQSNTRGTL